MVRLHPFPHGLTVGDDLLGHASAAELRSNCGVLRLAPLTSTNALTLLVSCPAIDTTITPCILL
jgi:hypothetical protein